MNPIAFFLPTYQASVLDFHEFPETFLLKEGFRCRYNCSVNTKYCEILECWNRPYVCLGNGPECWKRDGKGLCEIVQEDVETKTPFSVQKSEEYIEKTSVDFGRLLGILPVRHVISNRWYSVYPYPHPVWKCSLESDSEVLCIITGQLAGATVHLLKSIAG